jgi:hypothetical protein
MMAAMRSRMMMMMRMRSMRMRMRMIITTIPTFGAILGEVRVALRVPEALHRIHPRIGRGYDDDDDDDDDDNDNQ